MKWFATPGQLRGQGVMGMNQRNSDYIMRYNPRHLYPLVDDKVYTKRLALAKGIAVPPLYSVLEIQHEIKGLDAMLKTHQDFVMKPSHGSGGNGILVVDGRLGNHYRKTNGDLISSAAIGHHASNILSGMYSLGGANDQVLIEYRVQFDPFFSHISYQGVPDIRVIVFRGVPVAAMVRLPTRASDGKANLHQGAMGIGIDLVTGISKGGVCNDRAVSCHPDTGYDTTGIKIPHWDTIMKLAIRCADTVGLGYLGVDIVMDRDMGPLMLELNARPGLNVQIANQTGLLNNLGKIESLDKLPDCVDARLALAKAA
ncbi:MAG: alpha-L-glutamate ligase-like protein [Gammaproteobacteria bacterium]|nr:alpha-L-glutamate ligase-like protein [Gammaproteobacteria bacterium]